MVLEGEVLDVAGVPGLAGKGGGPPGCTAAGVICEDGAGESDRLPGSGGGGR